MFRTDSRVVKSGRNRINRCDLTVFVLAEQRFHAMENTGASFGNRGGMFRGINAKSGCFAADQGDFFIRDEFIKSTDGIASASDAGNHGIRQTAFFFYQLFFDFFSDNFLEITDNCREWMRSHDRTKYIKRVIHTFAPFTHCFIYGIF